MLKTWLSIPATHEFSIHNLPFGIFSIANYPKRVGVAIGDFVVDVLVASEMGIFDGLSIPADVLENDFLNDFIALGKSSTSAVRQQVQLHLCDEHSPLKTQEGAIISAKEVSMHLPVKVGDYTDFYSSIEHATNVGKMFRDPENALLPNWRHLPVGYHGRASSIVVSGTDIYRPNGQTKPTDGPPVFGPSQRMDFELEMAFIIGKETALGDTVSVDDADDHIFGIVLFNDWSARDIQKWEYVPLGPFLGKNFASSVSPWVVTMDALEPFRVEGPIQEPEVLPYLKSTKPQNYDINLQVAIHPESAEEETVVTNTNFKYMYWNMAQQLAHHTVNGCNLKVGDMMASGTISGKYPDSFGSMLELSWAGKNPVKLKDGSERKFLNDGDSVIMRGMAKKGEIHVGFGEVRSKLLAAKK